MAQELPQLSVKQHTHFILEKFQCLLTFYLGEAGHAVKLVRLGVGPQGDRTLTEDDFHLLDVSHCHHKVT